MRNEKREMRKNICFAVCLLLVASCLFTMIGCEEYLAAGKEGAFVLHIGDNSGRTIMPAQWEFETYELHFTGSNTVTEHRSKHDIGAPIGLLAGTYNLTVTAYADAHRAIRVATGTLSGIVISTGSVTAKNIVLYGIVQAGAEGSYLWKIGFPQGSNVFMSITPLDDDNIADIQTIQLLNEVQLDEQSIAEGVAHNEGEMILPAGYYRVTFSIDDGERDFSREDYMHIYRDMESNFEFTFTEQYFELPLPPLTGTVSIEGTVV